MENVLIFAPKICVYVEFDVNFLSSNQQQSNVHSIFFLLLFSPFLLFFLSQKQIETKLNWKWPFYVNQSVHQLAQSGGLLNSSILRSRFFLQFVCKSIYFISIALLKFQVKKNWASRPINLVYAFFSCQLYGLD